MNHIGGICRHGCASFAASLAFFIAITIGVAAVFGIFFETNDDVAMMMFAHGFGVAAVPSAALITSNILEGKIVQLIGQPFGFVGYGIYMMACLATALAFIHTTISRLNGRYWTTLLFTVALAVRPIFAPQFTVVSGILAIAAICPLLGDTRKFGSVSLLVASAFAVISFCMRLQMFLLVCVVALPLIVKWPARFEARLAGAVLGVVALCGSLFLLDRSIYQTLAWRAFEQWNLVRDPFTEYGLADRIHVGSAALARFGLTSLDIRLVSDWWWVGISAERVRQFLLSVGSASFLSMNLGPFVSWLKCWEEPSMIGATVIACATLLTVPARRLLRALASLLLLICVLLMLAAAGHPGVSRIVYPCILLIGVANFAFAERMKLVQVSAAVVLLIVSLSFIRRADDMQLVRTGTLAGFAKIRPTPVSIIWGAAIPYEALYGPLEPRSEMPSLRFYGLGVSELAPFALARWGGSENGLFQQFTSSSGIGIFAWPGEIALLRGLCSQKFRGQLNVNDAVSTRYFSYQRVNCSQGKTPQG
jgi:hypothetical protein